jgi:hypothetical protein
MEPLPAHLWLSVVEWQALFPGIADVQAERTAAKAAQVHCQDVLEADVEQHGVEPGLTLLDWPAAGVGHTCNASEVHHMRVSTAATA